MRSCKHTHVCCRLIQLRISPKDQRLQRLGRPPAAVGTHMCVAEQINAELHRRSRSTTFGRPNSAGSMHMCVAEQTNSRLHVCVANTPTVGGYKGLADQLLLRACKPQNKSIQGCLQSKGFTGLADQAWLGAYTRVLQNLSVQSCTYGPWVTRIWQISCYCERTHEHVRCRIITKVLPNKCGCEQTHVLQKVA